MMKQLARGRQPSAESDDAKAELSPVNANRSAKRGREAQLRYLSHATFLEEAGTPRLLAGVALVTCLCVSGFVAWAAMTKVTEVSHAPGEVVPAGFEQVVQHLDGGIVKAIAVEAGDLVREGQLLLVVDDGVTTENLHRARSRLVYLKLSVLRLRALYSGTRPEWSSVAGATREDIESQTNLLESAIADQEGQEKIVREQIDQKNSARKMFVNQLSNVATRQAISAKILEGRRELHAKKLIAYPTLARAEQEWVQLNGDATRLQDQIKQNSEELSELESRLASIKSKLRLDAAARMNDTLAEIQQQERLIETQENRFKRFEMHAPVDGYVKDLKVNTIGSVLSAGQVVMRIVPVNKELVVEVKVPPRDIGHVHVGQEVHVKFSAYDFSRYGVVKGKLEQISPGAFDGNAGETYFRARVRLKTNFVGSQTNRIIPGMTAMADIQTGEKSVLAYLLKPVRESAASALTER